MAYTERHDADSRSTLRPGVARTNAWRPYAEALELVDKVNLADNLSETDKAKNAELLTKAKQWLLAIFQLPEGVELKPEKVTDPLDSLQSPLRRLYVVLDGYKLPMPTAAQFKTGELVYPAQLNVVRLQGDSSEPTR